MLAAYKEPLSEKERQMVGRWKEIKSNDPTNPAFSIMREDRSSTYFLPFRSSIRMALPFRASLKILFHMACGESMAIDSICMTLSRMVKNRIGSFSPS